MASTTLSIEAGPPPNRWRDAARALSFVVVLPLSALACRQAATQRVEATGTREAASAAPLAVVPASSEPAGDHTPLPLSEGTSLPSPYVKARRGVLTRSPHKEMLADKQHLLREQFGDEASRPLGIQEAQLENARRAVLVSPLPDRPTPPLLLVLDERGSLLWTKPRPFAGTRPGIQHYAVTAAPRGGASMVWFDTASHVLALRLWDANGDILADFRLLEAEACDSLSAIYWPGVGHLVTIGKDGATQAQLLDANGGLVFGREGRVVSPKAWGRPGPVSLAIDTDRSVTFFFYAAAASGRGDDVHAVRFDDRGNALWRNPVVVGDVQLAPGAAAPEIDVTWEEDARLAVRLSRGRVVDLTSDGTVRLRPTPTP